MSFLSPRLQIAVKQKQILTPGLVQMVTVLQLNKLELQELINQEISQNPVLEEVVEGAEELTPAEVQSLLERGDPDPSPADAEVRSVTAQAYGEAFAGEAGVAAEAQKAPDAFEQIDYGSYFDDFMDPPVYSSTDYDPDKPGFETFLSSPVTLTGHLRQQLSLLIVPSEIRDATEAILGNLDETGYLSDTLENIAQAEGHSVETLEKALEEVQSLDPAGIGARSLQECLLLQLEDREAQGSVAWQIVENHLKLVESKSVKELARLLKRPIEHIQIALDVIVHLDPKPGLKYSGPGARAVEPDVYITKDGEDYVIGLSDEGLPQVRINGGYRHLLERGEGSDKETRNYIKDRYASALQLIRNIEQRKQTILRVCEVIVTRQRGFLESGIDALRPMMIKEVAEEIGVHASTVSRAVAGKYAHTPRGVFELRFFFTEAVQGPTGGNLSLVNLKRMVKQMIKDEDPKRPLTDDHIAIMLQQQGIKVTRRTVAKYREDMKIPSTHHRRLKD
ncbi:MAG TPA: RNA polymerase factor sigma-54 [Bryobacteraceae bacterium]|nr:RNA polymerase factor sigma-54 [Bryobacteraceae bacterium]HPT25144.1 RNA polymerase factor sigma-54 [Bryobacteraceae bacterium]